jgi:hypothetical protein
MKLTYQALLGMGAMAREKPPPLAMVVYDIHLVFPTVVT